MDTKKLYKNKVIKELCKQFKNSTIKRTDELNRIGLDIFDIVFDNGYVIRCKLVEDIYPFYYTIRIDMVYKVNGDSYGKHIDVYHTRICALDLFSNSLFKKIYKSIRRYWDTIMKRSIERSKKEAEEKCEELNKFFND